MKDPEKKPLHWTQIAEQIVLSVFACFLLYYAVSGLSKGAIYMPSGRASFRGFYLYGASMWVDSWCDVLLRSVSYLSCDSKIREAV
jgi:hypothetical protein